MTKQIASIFIAVEKEIFSKNNLALEYLTFGKGSNIILAFHGFGRKAEDFLLFEKILEEKYTVISFNFFHHGNSSYPNDRIEKNTLSVEELNDFFEYFLKEKNISRFSLMGYSMGGKICLSLLEKFANRIDDIFLFAPDGIKINFWYGFNV